MSQQHEQLYVRLVTSPIAEVILDQMEEYLPSHVPKEEDRVVEHILLFTVSQNVLTQVLQESHRRFAKRKYDLTHLTRRDNRLSRSPPLKILD